MCIHSPGSLGQTVNTLLLVGSRLQLQGVHHRRPRLDRTCQPQDTRKDPLRYTLCTEMCSTQAWRDIVQYFV